MLIGVYQTFNTTVEENAVPNTVDSRYITFTNATSKKFTINFNRVTSSIGGKIKTYIIEFSSQDDIFTITYTDNSGLKEGQLSIDIEGFINNHFYNVAVRAVDSNENSSISGIVNYTTPELQKISPVSLIISNIIDTELNIKFLGGTGGIGLHSYLLTYKEVGVEDEFLPLSNLDETNIDFIQSENLEEDSQLRKVKVKGLKPTSEYLFRIDVDDEDQQVLAIHGELYDPIKTKLKIFSSTVLKNGNNIFTLNFISVENKEVLLLDNNTFYSFNKSFTYTSDNTEEKNISVYIDSLIFINKYETLTNVYYLSPLLLDNLVTFKGLRNYDSSLILDFSNNTVLKVLSDSRYAQILLGLNEKPLNKIELQSGTLVKEIEDNTWLNYYNDISYFQYFSPSILDFTLKNKIKYLNISTPEIVNFSSTSILETFKIRNTTVSKNHLNLNNALNLKYISFDKNCVFDYEIDLNNFDYLESIILTNSGLKPTLLIPEKITNTLSFVSFHNTTLPKDILLAFLIAYNKNDRTTGFIEIGSFLIDNSIQLELDILESKGITIKIL